MSKNPKVSVAIITYNQKFFLKEALQSVVNQEYSDIEIVVADDCSTDGTQDYLKTLKNNEKIKFKIILGSENEGITRNCNRAFFACTGKYIAWLGGDDLMLPGKLKEQVTFMEEDSSCAICYHNLDVFDSSTNISLQLFNGEDEGSKAHEGGMEKLVEYGTFCGACSVMTRRAFCPINGFDVRIPVSSDWLFWIETAQKGKIRYINKVLGRYRKHAGNITNSRKHYFDEALYTLSIVDQKFPEMKRFVRKRKGALYSNFGIMFARRSDYGLAYRFLMNAFFFRKISFGLLIKFAAVILSLFLSKMRIKVNFFRAE